MTVVVLYRGQNVSSESFVVETLRSSVVVVILSTLLRTLFIQRFARWLVDLHEYGQVPDEIAINVRRTESLYVMQIGSALLIPVFAQFVLDENCMRV